MIGNCFAADFKVKKGPEAKEYRQLKNVRKWSLPWSFFHAPFLLKIQSFQQVDFILTRLISKFWSAEMWYSDCMLFWYTKVCYSNNRKPIQNPQRFTSYNCNPTQVLLACHQIMQIFYHFNVSFGCHKRKRDSG